MIKKNYNNTVYNNNSLDFEWYNTESSTQVFDIKMSNTEAAQLLIDQTMLNPGEDDGLLTDYLAMLNTEDFLPADFLEPIINGILPFDKFIAMNGLDASDFTLALAEIQQHLAFINLSETDFSAASQLLETGFSPRPDQFALLNS